MDEVTKAVSIATAVKRNFVIDDAEVPLYPALVKTMMKRDWTGADLGKGRRWLMRQKAFHRSQWWILQKKMSPK